MLSMMSCKVYNAAMRYAAGLSRAVQQLLEGSTDPDPGQHGLTTEEERLAGSLADFVALALESQKRREGEEQLRAMIAALEEGAAP